MMTEILDTLHSQAQSAKAHRKVRLKRQRTSAIMQVIFCLIVVISSVNSESRNNRPPRFLIDNQHSEIVLRLKEGPDTPVGKLFD